MPSNVASLPQFGALFYGKFLIFLVASGTWVPR